VIPVGATDAIPIDTRLIAATNRNLEDEIRRGSFRSDLFYRLNVIAIHLPSLRERKEDIPLLADAFLVNPAKVRGQDPKPLSEDALDALMRYNWPGNVRELENALERAVILTSGHTVEVSALPEKIVSHTPERVVESRATPNPTLDTIERAYIMWVLQSEGGNKTRAAETLGIDPSTLYRKLQRFGGDA
jgi:two-component system response regulator HydG